MRIKFLHLDDDLNLLGSYTDAEVIGPQTDRTRLDKLDAQLTQKLHAYGGTGPYRYFTEHAAMTHSTEEELRGQREEEEQETGLHQRAQSDTWEAYNELLEGIQTPSSIPKIFGPLVHANQSFLDLNLALKLGKLKVLSQHSDGGCEFSPGPLG